MTDDEAVIRRLGSEVAALYKEGRYREAVPKAEDRVRRCAAAYGEDNRTYATSLNNLALLYDAQGQYAKAEPLYQRSLAIREKALGPEHPDVAASLNNLAVHFAARGEHKEAVKHLARAGRIEDRVMGEGFAMMSESRRLDQVARYRGGVEFLLSLAIAHPDAGAVTAAYDLVLRRKGLVTETLAMQRDTVLGGRYPELRPRLDELKIIRASLAEQLLHGPANGERRSDYEARLAALRRQRDDLETLLSRAIPEMRLEKTLAAADTRAVATRLPPHATLVEYVRYRRFDFRAVPARGQESWQEYRYAAFVLRPGDTTPTIVDMGEAEAIDQAIDEYRAAVAPKSGETRLAQAAGGASDAPEDHEISARLYA